MALPQLQMDLCHGSHLLALRTANLGEAIEQVQAEKELHNEAMHLRLHKAAPVVAAPLLPDAEAELNIRASILNQFTVLGTPQKVVAA